MAVDPAALLRELALERELANRRAVERLATFARLAWPLLEGRPLVWTWYHDLICDELEAVVRGEHRQLVIAIPPRCMKSYLVSVFLPAWAWLQHPEWSVLAVSNEQSLATRDSLRSLHLLTSSWYAQLRVIAERDHGIEPWNLDHRQAEKVNFANTRGGQRQALSTGSKITGKGCDLLICDDLIDASEAIQGDPERVAERMADTVTWHDQVLQTRFNDATEAREVVIGQRLHALDVPGAMLTRGWRSVVLPMRAEAGREDRHPGDKRQPGELLDPVRFPEVAVEKLEAALGDQAPGQLQQRPQAKGGGMLAVASWLWVDRSAWPSKFAREACGWDLAIGASEGASNSAGFWGGLHDGRVYVGDAEVGKWEISGQIEAIRRLSMRHPRSAAKYIEHRANARAAIDLLRREVAGLVPVEPDGDKVTRVQAWAPYLAAGNLVLPCRCGNTEPHRHGDEHRLPGELWAVELVRECAAFPRGARKDRVDALGYLVRPLLTRTGGLSLSAA